MRTRKLIIALVAVSSLGVANASADVTLELIGSGDFTVEPATVASPTDVFPLQGEPLIVWARITNTGPDTFRGTGPGGTQASGSGTISLWSESPGYLWNPLADSEDALVVTPLGYRGIELDPGESFALPVREIWGLSTIGLDAAPVGSFTTIDELTLSFWAGFDRDPNDPFDPPDLFIPLDRSFTVTVVPEPAMLALLGVIALGSARRRGSPRSD